MSIGKFPLAVAVCGVVVGGTASASTVTLAGTNVAVSIQDLDVDGTLYDVVFERASDSVFAGSGSSALDAILAALNGTSADLVSVAGGNVDAFSVADGSGFFFGSYEGTPGDWVVTSVSVGQEPEVRAVLTVSSVPVPASLPLLAVGLGGLGLMARRKRKAA